MTISGHISYAYNLTTKVMISTRFSGWKHSTIINPAAKDPLKKVVAMETVTNCFWFKSTSSRYQGIFYMLITHELKLWFRRHFQDGNTTPLSIQQQNIVSRKLLLWKSYLIVSGLNQCPEDIRAYFICL